MDNTYVRLQNTLNSTGTLIPTSDFDNEDKLKEHIKVSPESDWYSSLFYFGPEAKEYFDKNNGSVKGYNGPAHTKKLVFDFDSKADINLAKKDALALLHKLSEQEIDVLNSTRVFFSGNKGFHVELYTTREFTPDECKDLSVHLKKLYNLTTLDTVIYNTTRLYRLNNTKNDKSGLYKIELEPDDLDLPIEVIKERAKEPNPSWNTVQPTNNLKFIDAIKILYANSPKTRTVTVDVEEDESGIRGLETINFDNCPKYFPRCLFALSHGIMQPGIGERNTIFLRLAAFYKNQGLTKDVCHNTLKGIARENAKLYPEFDQYTKEEIYNTVISSVYSENGTWKQIPGSSGTSEDNELLKRYCTAIDKRTNKRCSLHSKVDNHQEVVQINNVSNSFHSFAENFEKNRVSTGIGFIDNHMKLAVGTTTLLVGATGSGKTTVALNIMEQANALGQHTMFFSLDMHKNLIYLKLAQKLTNYTQDEILSFYKNKDAVKTSLIRDLISKKYDKTYFDFSSTLTVEQMRDKVFQIEEQTGNKIKLCVVDYAGRISGPHADRYANATYNALQSTGVANATDCAWIYISQISRNMGDGCTPLRTKRAAKESGDWEESATNVVTMWRPFMGDPGNDDVIRMYLAKNRMGSEVEEVLHWNGAKGIVRDMNAQEEIEYKGANREQAERDHLKARRGQNQT